MDSAAKPRRQGVATYVFTVLAIAAATILIALVPPLVQRGAFVVYLAVVALVTWFGGWRPGILAIALTACAAAIYVLPPPNSFWVTDWADVLRLGVFVLVASIIAALHGSRERAREQAWQTEQRLNFALQCANMGAWFSDMKTGKFWWSEGMEKLFGRAPGSFSGSYEGFIGYIHPDDQDFVKRAITKTVEGGKEFEIEHRIVRPDGQTRWIITRGRIVHDDAGLHHQIIGVAADITDRKAREGAGE